MLTVLADTFRIATFQNRGPSTRDRDAERRRLRRELADLDDHLMRDIGLWR
ncbi:DUF1127 domain-containing protein [Defluviimonas sp. WL0024]|uniref:DUF1127 domain-containing protein n=2 Tax=Albidovulum TaxID=205889 RepID=A0ABT3J1G5_9RHOB|nr:MULTISPECIES: DUF1127 domain-containing protein [Defluviimonas]MCU9848051.1 DUF1127 domain-containing protein [Defluviimonas sp. WL0024]MCW3781519.1 DUF1127 domain-containing protein [Defluviimonas salinarum]